MKKGSLFIIPFVFIVSCAISIMYLTYFNTLENRNDWFSPEVDASKPVSHGEYFYRKRISLAEGQLDLGTWHGSNLLITKNSFAIKKLKVRFRLSENAYLAVGVEDRYNVIHGFRLSQVRLFPTVFFRADAKGEFLEKAPISFPVATGSDWQEAEIDLTENPFHLADFSELKPVLRNGPRPVQVDWIEAFDENGQLVFRDGFFWKTGPFLAVFSLSFVSLMLIFLGLYSLENKKLNVFRYLLILFTVTFCGLLFWAFYFFSLSHRYPAIESAFSPPSLQKTNRWWLLPDQPAASKKTVGDYLTLNHAKLKAGYSRVIFYGSSQTWGEGARRDEETWANVTCQRLKDKKLVLAEAVCLNFAEKGSVSSQIKDLVQADQSFSSKDLVIINLANNDRNPPLYRANYLKIVRHLKSFNVGLFLMLEPNEPQVNSTHLEVNHNIIRNISVSENIACFDVHSYMLNPALIDAGFLWWDHVHPTSFGHLIIGDAVAAAVKLAVQ